MDLKGSKTEKNLMTAFAGESQARNKYNFYAKIAKEEGYEQIAELFDITANNEKEHEERYRKLLANIKNGEVFHSEEKVVWECMDCGHLHYGNDAPGKCPVCGAEKAKFKRRAVNY